VARQAARKLTEQKLSSINAAMLVGEMGGIFRQPKNEQCSKPLFVDVAS
jgi:hypothetical protein